MKQLFTKIKKIFLRIYWLLILVLFAAVSYYLFNFYLSANQKVDQIMPLIATPAIDKVELTKASALIDQFKKAGQEINPSSISNPFLKTIQLPAPEISLPTSSEPLLSTSTPPAIP